jgi:hypothetical protein
MRCFGMMSLGIMLLFAAPPAAPTDVNAVVAHSAITVRWASVAGATSYRIYRGTRSHGEGSIPYAGDITSLFFVNTRVSKGVTYYYEVTAVDRNGESARSAEISASLTPPAPAHNPPPASQTQSAGRFNGGAFLVIILLLIAGAGLAYFVWRRTGGTLPARITRHLTAPATSADPYAIPSAFAADEMTQAAPPLANGAGQPIELPATVFPGEGLVARYGTSVPTGALADPEPLNEIFNEPAGNTVLDRANGNFTGLPPDGSLVPPHQRLLSGALHTPAWPVARPPGPASGNASDSSRTLLFVIAGMLVVTGIMALVLWAYFAATSGGTTQGGTSAPAAQATATAHPTATHAPPTPSPVPAPTAVAAIDAGGAAAGGFSADMDFSGGQTDTTTNPIDTSGVSDPAPQAVYQSERWGDDFTYRIPNLTPHAQYRVRLHFAEIYFSQPGQRLFNVTINGQQVLNDFDVLAAAGGPDKAIVREFIVTARDNGVINIHFTDGSANHPKISGIEIIPVSSQG